MTKKTTLSNAQRMRVANFSGSEGKGELSRTDRALVKKGVFTMREDFMITLHWGEGWKERGEEIQRQVAEVAWSRISEEAREALLEWQFHEDLRREGLGYEHQRRGSSRTLMRTPLGSCLAKIMGEERG